MLNGSKEKIFHLFGALPPLVQFVREGKLLQNHMQIKYSIIYFSTFSNRNREVIEEQEEVLWRLLSVFFFTDDISGVKLMVQQGLIGD